MGFSVELSVVQNTREYPQSFRCVHTKNNLQLEKIQPVGSNDPVTPRP